MKKMLMNFTNSLLSREQMKKVRGGYEGGDVSSYWARCFEGNELKCRVLVADGCSLENASSACSACELEWDCADCE